MARERKAYIWAVNILTLTFEYPLQERDRGKTKSLKILIKSPGLQYAWTTVRKIDYDKNATDMCKFKPIPLAFSGINF